MVARPGGTTGNESRDSRISAITCSNARVPVGVTEGGAAEGGLARVFRVTSNGNKAERRWRFTDLFWFDCGWSAA